MLFLGLFLFALAFGSMAVFPETRATLRRHRTLVFGLSVAYLAPLILHPYIFGLPGRIAERRFQAQLHPGMTRADVIRLARQYGGANPFRRDWNALAASDWPAEGSLYASFTDWETLCIAGGNEYGFNFRPDGTVSTWTVRHWENAC